MAMLSSLNNPAGTSTWAGRSPVLGSEEYHDVINPTRIRALLSCGLFQDVLFFSVGVPGDLGF
jgi:hypothetical protein